MFHSSLKYEQLYVQKLPRAVVASMKLKETKVGNYSMKLSWFHIQFSLVFPQHT